MRSICHRTVDLYLLHADRRSYDSTSPGQNGLTVFLHGHLEILFRVIPGGCTCFVLITNNNNNNSNNYTLITASRSIILAVFTSVCFGYFTVARGLCSILFERVYSVGYCYRHMVSCVVRFAVPRLAHELLSYLVGTQCPRVRSDVYCSTHLERADKCQTYRNIVNRIYLEHELLSYRVGTQ